MNAMLDVLRSAGVIALLLAPGVVLAQAPPTPEAAATDDNAAAAASAAQEGKTLFDAGLYDAAIERFEASLALVPSADVQFAIAEAYRAKGDTENAVLAYKRYKALTDKSAPAPDTINDTSPEVIEPSQMPPVESAPRPTLPRALVQRRLLLSPGLAEAWVAMAVGQQTIGQQTGVDRAWSFGAAGAGARVGVGAGELFADGLFVIFHNDPMNTKLDVPVLQRASAGMQVRITDDTGLGARITGIALGSDYSGYAPGLFFAHKLHPSDAGAIVITGAASYMTQNLVGELGYAHEARGVAASGGGTLQLQVLPAVAVEASGTVTAAWYLEDLHPGSRSQRLYAFGADAVIAVSDRVDLVPFFSGLPIADAESFACGLQVTVH